MQTCSIDRVEQHGSHDNALQQGLFPLRGFIDKHGKPLITTRAIEFTIKYYLSTTNENSLLQNIKHFLRQSTK